MKNYFETLFECAEIAKERQEQYGQAQESIKLTNEILDKAFNVKLTDKEICYVLIAMKLARQKYKPKEDNILDIINYLAMSINIE